MNVEMDFTMLVVTSSAETVTKGKLVIKLTEHVSTAVVHNFNYHCDKLNTSTNKTQTLVL